MSGVEGLFIGAVIGAVTNLLTNGVNPLLQLTRAAVRCEGECQKLAEVIESIKTKVQHIKGQLEELQHYDPNSKQDLSVVGDLVKTLKEELHLADIELHGCDTASKIGKRLGGYRLSRKITTHNEKLTALAKELVPINLQFTNMLKDARSRCSSMEFEKRLFNMELQQRLSMDVQQRASMEFQQHPLKDLHQWNREKDDILQREDSTRLLQRLQSENSVHSGYGSSSPSVYADDSSQHSSHHSSHHLNRTYPSQYQRSYTTPTPHVTHPGAQIHRSYSTKTHDQTLAATLASAYGHDPEPAYDKWKY